MEPASVLIYAGSPTFLFDDTLYGRLELLWFGMTASVPRKVYFDSFYYCTVNKHAEETLAAFDFMGLKTQGRLMIFRMAYLIAREKAFEFILQCRNAEEFLHRARAAMALMDESLTAEMGDA